MLTDSIGVMATHKAVCEPSLMSSEGTNPLFALVSNVSKDSRVIDAMPDRKALPLLLRASLLKFVAAVSLICALPGCLTTPPPSESFPVAAEPKVVLQPGDVLQVKFLYWPELNEEKQAIRPDGKISLQLVGDVQAEGRTPDELRTDLLSIYEDKLIEPEIAVVVNSLDSHRVYVGGEVMQPGLVMISGRLTALEAIMQAGGFKKQSAKMASVVVIRQREGKQFSQSLDLRKAIESPESEPFLLEPYDIVFVPRSNIDQIDQWVDQYINQIVPRSLHYSFTHDVNPPEYSNGNSGIASQLLNNIGTINSAMPRLGELQSAR
ncbi:MAG TPA: polysaccharide biosynthesis/export family protein [Candidatus Hydrogenedentes bacterium]|nr:polysaccharide biosynthesis/export family protein [Candidatus Hydrogenedentota bacterium]